MDQIGEVELQIVLQTRKKPFLSTGYQYPQGTQYNFVPGFDPGLTKMVLKLTKPRH